MAKSLLKIFFFAIFFWVSPVAFDATENMNAMDIPGAHEIEITISQTTLRVTGGAGQVLYIYNVAGVCVMTLRVDSNDKRFDLNLAKGCYIVKVGRTVRKVSIH